MKKLWKLEQLQVIKSQISEQVVESMKEAIITIDEEYGTGREVEADLGGFVLLLESETDVKELKVDKLNGLLAEYTDEIKSDDGTKYYSSLFLLSSDYAIMVYSNKELHELLLRKVL
ncbi:hypothetical protein C1H57_08220 [Clostridium sp. 2-1]|uniref:hypothetical protein n=1 Tax=Clostridium TaxID=1485 RepID=UPI00041596FF|nr:MULTISPECIES: hypothetical protein [Clostridium]MBN7575391.1 hypothetical protein [Clostridium beijerinckii]MBN7580702.1 hypothetical protein [Clostridium beijerinckii]MBN7585155.1 hypothetical protein [Clostridium beijerinckii]MBO0522515.1 hypothetical protein [Clostridium beijerinckii]POO91797.1 hypothetical protein C1H57_08220 [Clostridium sp. 2-1]